MTDDTRDPAASLGSGCGLKLLPVASGDCPVTAFVAAGVIVFALELALLAMVATHNLIAYGSVQHPGNGSKADEPGQAWNG